MLGVCLAIAAACGPIGSDGTTSLAPEAAPPVPDSSTPVVDSGVDSGTRADTGPGTADSEAGADAFADAVVGSDAPAD